MFVGLINMASILLRLTQKIWHTGTCVVLDSGFCVSKGITEIQRRGVFPSTVIKKRRYFKNNNPDSTIILHFIRKTVGNIDYL